MEKFSLPIQLRWVDMDANKHLRHSAYYDFGAMTRVAFLSGQGLSTEKLEEYQIGPILFREEAVFRREIRYEDSVVVELELIKSTRDFGRWSMRHNIYKNSDTLAAVITVDGAWIDMLKRKLATPTELIQEIFERFPKAPDFHWVEIEKK